MSSAKILPFIGPGVAHVAPGPSPVRSVRLQLVRILRSPGFVKAARMKRFLSFVVEETLAGRANQICEYSIGVSVFEKKESFDPAIDPIVRNDARRLRSKLAEYYRTSNRPNEILIDIPKGGYVPTFGPDARPIANQTGSGYKLVISLVRVEDNVALWSTEQDFTPEHPLPRFPI
jgi:hypothetical protein